MRIGEAVLVLVLSVSLVIQALETPLPHNHAEDSLTFENFMAMTVSTGQSCSSGPIAVQVRISTCFSPSEVSLIDSWVEKSLAAVPQAFFVNNQAIEVNFVAALASSVSNDCPSDSIEKTGTPLTSSLHFMTSQAIANPASAISFIKDNYAVSSLATTPGYHLKIRICTTCTPQSDEIVLSSLTLLDSTLSAPVIAQYLPCSATPGSVALTYVGADNEVQCMCACPAGSVLSSGACQSSAGSGSNQCYWIGSSSSGSTCSWSKSGSAPLKLITDCAVAYHLPTDNYVADDRVNAYDTQTPLRNPLITIQSVLQGSAGVTSISSTWKEFMTSTTQKLDGVTFSNVGVYSVDLTASDYSSSILCTGCVAVVDAYPPRAISQCATSSWGSASTNPTVLTSASQAEAIAKETSFIGFDAASNVNNNLGGSYWSDKSRAMRNFYSDVYTALSSDTDTCFNVNLVQNLLDHPSSVTNPLTAGLTESALSALSCTRCCNKTTTLQEYYNNYKCGQNPANAEKKTATGDSCNFQHCIRVQSTSLVNISARISDTANKTSTVILANLTSPTTTSLDGRTIHRTVPCTTFSASCSTSATLGSLFELSSSWKTDFLGSQDAALSYNVSRYVFWRYKVGGGSWNVWDASTSPTFSSASTTVTIQAWTRCGFVQEFSFTVIVHLHATRNTCSSFPTMWQPISSNSTSNSSYMCTYGNSSFAAMKFVYSGVTPVVTAADTVTASFKSVNCSIRVTDSVTNIANVVATPMNVTNGSAGGAVTEYFAVEQVTYASTATTNARVECSFTFHPYGVSATDATWDERDACTHNIVVTNCGEDNSSSVCDYTGSGRCTNSTSTGANKACAGAIYTASNSSATVSKSPLACCSNCKRVKGVVEPLTCTRLSEVSDSYINPLKQCVFAGSSSSLLLSSLALDHQETRSKLSAATLNTALREKESWVPAQLFIILVVSGIAGLALVAFRKLTRSTPTSHVVNDGYRAFLD